MDEKNYLPSSKPPQTGYTAPGGVTGSPASYSGGAASLAAGPTWNEKVLFWASFITLIAAGMGFSIRGDILADWGRDFGFTQTELGIITGQGLAGFGITIIFFSFFADVIGYGKLMIVAFLLHTLSVVLTIAAPFAFAQYGKDGAFYCLYLGAWAFSLGNGTCEAVINPLTASLFPKNKTHWLNILHAGWPAGLVVGAVLGMVLDQITRWAPSLNWQVRWGIVFAPMLLYGVLMLGRRFPTSEAKASAISMKGMMSEVGLLGFAVVVAFLGLWLSSDIFPWLLTKASLPASLSWLGWALAAVLWIGFGSYSQFRIGHWMLAFLYVLHGLVGFVELGTDSWIQDITKTVLSTERVLGLGSRDLAKLAFIWVNVLMFTLRFFAGPIVHKISPVGLLLVSAVIGATGLWLLGLPATTTAWLWLGAATIYALGKTFYWPTMLGVVSERYPKGGALALGFSGGVGMLAAGLLGGPGIGYFQDYAAVQQLHSDPDAYARYESYKTKENPTAKDYYELDAEGHKIPAKKGFLQVTGLFPDVAGLDGARVGVLLGDPGADNGMAKKLDIDIRNYRRKGAELEGDPALYNLNEWWDKEGKPNSSADEPVISDARLHGGKQALTWTAYVPAALAVGYLLLVLYFLARGGYKAQVLVGHAAEDEKFTGGTEGPGEG
jgi:MFS family permease